MLGEGGGMVYRAVKRGTGNDREVWGNTHRARLRRQGGGHHKWERGV